jgi:hypothetical protein
MTDLLQDRSRIGHWEDAEAGRPTDWEALFAGYRSVVDYPGCLYWRELVARYPNAKVLHTSRDPDAWWESAVSTIYQSSAKPKQDPTPEELRHRRYVDASIWGRMFDGRFLDKEHAIARVREHEQAVIRDVPADRLLVYSVGQGWEPLCRFLGVAVPSFPFPKLNTRAEFLARAVARDSNAAGVKP